MSRNHSSLRAIRWGACALALVIASASRAQAPVPPSASTDELRNRFPPSSIDSVQKADDALAATSGTKVKIDKEYRAEARACMSKVLVNDCLDTVRLERRNRMADIDAIELEANRFKRAEHQRQVDSDRTQREAARQANAPVDADQRARNRQAYEDKQASAAKSAADKDRSNATRTPKKTIVHGNAPAQTGEQRAQNAASFDRKKQEAVAHNKDIDRRLVEKEADRKRRADAKAAKDAKQKAAVDATHPSVASPTPTAPEKAQPKP
jgi:colicin import membrane protein